MSAVVLEGTDQGTSALALIFNVEGESHSKPDLELGGAQIGRVVVQSRCQLLGIKFEIFCNVFVCVYNVLLKGRGIRFDLKWSFISARLRGYCHMCLFMKLTVISSPISSI